MSTNPLIDRLRAAARDVADADDHASAAHERRDRLIVEAVDAGNRQRDVAAAAGISHARLIAVLARSQPQPAPAPEVLPRDIAPGTAA